MEKVWGWNRPSEVLEKWRDLAAKHQLLQEDQYAQGYEDDLDILVNAVKQCDKRDKDGPYLCRAIWRRKHARRRHVDRQKKLECCEEERAPPAKPKSKHLTWERVFGNSHVPKALSLISTAPSLSFHTLCRVRHYDKPRTKIENGWLICGTCVLQTHQFSSVMSCSPGASRS